MYGKGEKAFDKVPELLKGKKWPELAAACEATIAADPNHMDAHWWLAIAYAQDDKTYAKVGPELSIALAGDWLRWGPRLDKIPELAAYLKSPAGEETKKLNAQLRTAVLEFVKKNVLVVGHRTRYRAPDKGGVHYDSTRAELFAFDPTGNRYVAITHTGFTVAGVLPGAAPDTVVYLSWNRVKLPEKDAPADMPTTIVEARVGVVDLATPETVYKEVTLKEDARAIAVQYDVGDKLVATVYAPGKGRWELGAPKTFALDTVSGEAKPAKDPSPDAGARLLVSYEEVTLSRGGDVDGVEADFRPPADAASAFKLKQSQKTVTLPGGESAVRGSFVWSPAKGRLAFATAGDPCAAKPADQQSSLYVVEAATGKLKHVDSGISSYGVKWLGEDSLIYEDDKGGLRVYDATAGRAVAKKESRAGLAFAGASATPPGTRICKTAPPAAPASSAATDDPEGAMPPEEKVTPR
jgi:hypothetical protein